MTRPAEAKPPEIPASLRQLMADIGPRWGEDVPGHVRKMLDGFTQLLANAPKGGVDVTRDHAYGDHARQRVDVFRPQGAQRAPIVIFVHGGAFVDGDRNRTSEIYANVLYYFARHGVVGVNVGHRQAQDAKYPEGTRDIARAVQWVRANATSIGGDAQRIFLMGHSAGAAHAGSYAYDRRQQPQDGHGLAGFIVVSGRVRAELLPNNPNAPKVAMYYGNDPAVLEDGSPVTHVGKDSVPTMIAFAEYENPLIDVHCSELAFRVGVAQGRAPRVMRMAGHNHTSIIAHFNTAEDVLGREILDFIHTA